MKNPRGREICIRNWRDPFPTKTGIAVVFDIFRCSTTLACLTSYRDDGVWITKNLAPIATLITQHRVYSELSEARSLPLRFDNSPAEALSKSSREDLKSPCLVATTSGTPAMFAARAFEEVWVGSFTNFSALVKILALEERTITLIPAAAPDSGHVEDAIAAEEIAIALDGFCLGEDFVVSCANKGIEKIRASGRVEELAKKLPRGEEDTAIALDRDRFNHGLKINFRPGSNVPGLAKVVKCVTG